MAEIGMFIRSMEGGGAQRAMVRLASGFAKAGHSVEVLTLYPDGSFRSELSPQVKLTTLSAKRTFGAVRAIARYMRTNSLDAFLVTEPTCNIAVIIAKLLVSAIDQHRGASPRILIREGLYPSVAMREDPHLSTRLAYRFAPLLYRYADVIVAIANDMAIDLADVARLDRSRITTIPFNPVVTPELNRIAAERPGHAWFLNDVPVVLGVGRLDRQKDFSTLLRAFEYVRARRPCRLLILGDGPLRPDIEAARNASRYKADIDLPGFTAQPFSYMASCDVFVLSSRYEGQPNVLIEALACGATVVATDCPSGPWDILAGGRHGQLVPVGDAVEMAQAIVHAIDHPQDRNASRARGVTSLLRRALPSI